MTIEEMDTEILESIKAEGPETPPARRFLPEPLSPQLLAEIFELVLISWGFYGLIYWLPRGYFFDGLVRLHAIINLFQSGTITRMNYSYIGPFFSYPLWLLDLWNNDHRWWIERYNVFVCIAVFLFTYILLRKRMNASILRAFFLIFLFGSLYASQYRYFGGETFTSLLVGMGILIALLVSEFGGWLAVAIGVANVPACLVGAGLVTLRYMIERRRLRYALILVATLGVLGLANWLTRGTPFNSGYVGQTFSTPFLVGLLSILFSFGKGLLYFVPALLLPVKKSLFQAEGKNKEKIYLAYKLWMYFLAGMILLYSSWWAWDGGWFWGPRFFLFASIPASFVLAVRLRNPSASLRVNLLVILLFAYTIWVSIMGGIMDNMGPLINTCMANNYAMMILCQYVPGYSVLWAPLVNHWSLPSGWRTYLAFTLCVALYLAIPTLLAIAKQMRAVFPACLPQVRLWLKTWRA